MAVRSKNDSPPSGPTPVLEPWRDVSLYLDDPGLDIPEKDERLLWRTRCMAILLAVSFAVLAARLWQLQVATADEHLEQARANRVRSIPLPPPRGLIFDRHNRVLARSEAHYCASIVPAELRDRKRTFGRLALLLGIKPEEIDQVLPDSARMQSYVPVKIKKSLTPIEIATIEENRMRLPGVIVEPELVRRYPRGSFAAQILGHVGEVSREELEERQDDPRIASGDIVGKDGEEKKYDRYLQGDKGSSLIETDARGNPIAPVGQREERVGKSVVLTLDARLQSEAEDALRASGHRGAAVMMNVKSGDVLLMASYPGFDPNVFAAGIKPEVWRRLSRDKSYPLLNRAASSKYPPGSTFKLITITAGLSSGEITPSSSVHCSGGIRAGRLFRCTGHHGTLNLLPAFARSCNSYFMTVGRRVGATRMADTAHRLGLAARTGIDLPGESAGTIPDPVWRSRRKEKWYAGETLNMAIGQGAVEVTPLQMVCLVSAVANDGYWPAPHLLKEIRAADGSVETRYQPKLKPTGIDPHVLEIVRAAMRQVVLAGTGRALRTPVVTIAAKTGSAQNVHGPKTHAWIVCFAPYEKPEIACVVMLENAGHGGAVAAPIARRLLEAAFKKSS